jgi:hypothetical protein
MFPSKSELKLAERTAAKNCLRKAQMTFYKSNGKGLLRNREMNDQQNERGGVFPSRDCRVNPGEGFVPGSAPELHRKARTAPEKMKSMLLGSVVVGRIFIPLYSDAVAFSIILDMIFFP